MMMMIDADDNSNNEVDLFSLVEAKFHLQLFVCLRLHKSWICNVPTAGSAIAMAAP